MEAPKTRECAFCGRDKGNVPFVTAVLVALGGKPTGYAHLPCIRKAKKNAPPSTASAD